MGYRGAFFVDFDQNEQGLFAKQTLLIRKSFF